MSAFFTLDGYPVVVGDNVVDTAFGPGTVIGVTLAQCSVRFPLAVVQMYATTGVSTTFTRRTLYWADPVDVVGAPSKNPARRQMIASVMAPLVALVNATVSE